MATGNIADRHARLQRLVADQELLLRRKPPPAGTADDDFHLRKRVGHRRMPRTSLAPPANAGVRSKRGAVQPTMLIDSAPLRLALLQAFLRISRQQREHPTA
jgi:hypothetical protein